MKLKVILFVMLLTSACSFNATTNSVDEKIMENVAYPQSTEIIYKENFKNGIIVLYQDRTGFRSDFFIIKENYFVKGGNAELNPEGGLSWTMRNDPHIPIVLFGGVITDEKIEEIIVKQRTVEQKARIIDTDYGKRYWFATFEVLEESLHGEGDPLKIEAYDDKGNLYWKSGVYDEGLYEGRTN
ncbi:hypothetical protein M670_03706 [Schinkia azotoformans MEV2011]|uniref:Uncharacterized protein n=1 Tax=Schinkia azotoformans MEV2011 TaxID=1348973 RepID=A0A072NJS3_SCHAZ|nr:hypothetical protein [Schinkia azotoformans]KEF37113.1 hypothetical protein M670_03706 [Schinkia azotoformans MEV2011]MEC1694334.1 hypothetical protein [Schinkia azotoformans]MEC1717975.1 hypothetical protein [Schinkia azotoformans]MEC1723383.1 hypothetical protein [Schinkia azotoformans]MEC1743294.1 hypothetical protein [Schinkia azotoformans]